MGNRVKKDRRARRWEAYQKDQKERGYPEITEMLRRQRQFAAKLESWWIKKQMEFDEERE